jgi:membrane-associated phospholipid phosphatase
VLVTLILLGIAATAGVVGYVVARRWPRGVASPVADPATIEDEVERHPGVADALRSAPGPASVTGVALTAALVAIVAAVVGFGLLVIMVQSDTGLARWDLSFARFGADHASERSTDLLRTVSLLGGTSGVLALTAVTAAVTWTRMRSLAVVGFLALCALGQFALSNLVKLGVDRERPDILHLTGFSGSSFPSGHSTAAAAALMACALVLGRGRSPRVRAGLLGVAAAAAAAVATTRVLLGVHWFTDVLAGLLLGWLWFAVCSIAFGGRRLRFGAPVETAESAADHAL